MVKGTGAVWHGGMLPFESINVLRRLEPPILGPRGGRILRKLVII